MTHTCNLESSTWEIKKGDMSFKPAWATEYNYVSKTSPVDWRDGSAVKAVRAQTALPEN